MNKSIGGSKGNFSKGKFKFYPLKINFAYKGRNFNLFSPSPRPKPQKTIFPFQGYGRNCPSPEVRENFQPRNPKVPGFKVFNGKIVRAFLYRCISSQIGQNFSNFKVGKVLQGN